MKLTDIRGKTPADLQELLTEKRAELAEKRRSLHAGELQNPRSITELRRDIAKIMTILNQENDEEKQNV